MSAAAVGGVTGDEVCSEPLFVSTRVFLFYRKFPKLVRLSSPFGFSGLPSVCLAFEPNHFAEMIFKLVLACLALACAVNSLTAESTFLNDVDKARLKKVVELKEPLASNELSTIYYNAHVNLLLEKTLPDASKICSHIQAKAGDSLESIYFITSTAKLLGNCPLDANKYQTKLQSFIQPEAPVIDLFRASASLINLGKPIDSSKLSKLLVAAVKRDETLLNTGLAFQLAAKFTKPEDRNVFVDKIGDIIVQADEVNERLLQVYD